eukprot:1152791-Pelagomonas_calceolata.AAC.7
MRKKAAGAQTNSTQLGCEPSMDPAHLFNAVQMNRNWNVCRASAARKETNIPAVKLHQHQGYRNSIHPPASSLAYKPCLPVKDLILGASAVHPADQAHLFYFKSKGRLNRTTRMLHIQQPRKEESEIMHREGKKQE